MGNSIRLQLAKNAPTGVEFSPPGLVRRRLATWARLQGDTVEITRLERFEYGVKSPFHVLIASERAERTDGETVVEGFQKSTQREFSRKLSFLNCAFPKSNSSPDCSSLTGTSGRPPSSRRKSKSRGRMALGHVARPRTRPIASRYCRRTCISRRTRRYRGSPRRGNPAATDCGGRAVEPLPFCAGVQAVVRRAAAPLSHEPPDGACQDAAGSPRTVGDGGWHDAGFCRDELVHDLVSPLGRDHSVRLPPQRRLR
jgi:hypothetical protein